MVSLDFCAQMPKAELHLHLEGTFEPTLVRKIAERNRLPLPASFTTRSEGYDFHDLPSFLSIYYSNMTVLQTQEDFFDLAWAYLVKAHSQNVIHVEMFFDPQAHTSRGVSFKSVIDGYHQAIIKAEKELNMSALLIMCFLRDMSAESAMSTLEESLAYGHLIIGVGLDSDEKNNPPSKFAKVFQKARSEGYYLTMHCDIDQQNSIEHIRQALEDIKVDRIDHGTNIVEDDRLVEIVKSKGIGLTCCPVSNSVVTEDFKGKEILSLLRQNVKTTVNSDDPAYFRAYMTENVFRMTQGTDVTKKELIQLQRNAFQISWIPDLKKKGFLLLLDEYEASHSDCI
jgi:adenosine deaminase